METPDVAAAFDRHTRIAFQLSGGRDSLAALWVLRPYWGRMRVYHMDTGDQFPETKEVIRWVEQRVPVERIRSDSKRFHESAGWPSDIVPARATPLGRAADGEEAKVVGRFDCCWHNLMWPMHERMREDGITLIVRGQRDEDYANPVTRSGYMDGGLELLYPIQSWTTEQVTAYCLAHGLPLARWYYEGASHGSDCMHCTAWWDDGRLPYMRRHHPQEYAEVARRIIKIRSVVERQCAPLIDAGVFDGG